MTTAKQKATLGPWHPCVDGLDPIATGLERFARDACANLHEQLRHQSTYPSYRLAYIFNEPGYGPGSGTAGRREMVRRWLQFHGFVADSTELARRLDDLLAHLITWEQRAKEDAARNSNDCYERKQRGLPVELVHRLGESTCEAYNELLDEAEYAADYIRQLSAMVRGKIAAHQAQKIPPTEEWSAPMTKAEIAERIVGKGTRPRKIATRLAEWQFTAEPGQKLGRVRLDRMDLRSRKKLEAEKP